MRLLITGASGLLGINLALIASGEHDVIGAVNEHPIQVGALPSDRAFTVLRANLLQPGSLEQIWEHSQPDWVIHCAALANLDACEANPTLAFEMNAELPRRLAALAFRKGVRLLHVSTDAVFDGRRGDYTEEDQPNPLSVYSRAKFAAEQAVVEENPQAIIARVNIYGWGITGKRSLAEFFYNNLSVGKPSPGFTDVFFCPLLVNDLSQILLKMMEKNLEGLYHVVGGEGISKYSFGMALAERFGFDASLVRPASVNSAGLQAARSQHLVLRTDKIAHALGEAPPGLAAGMERFYQLYQQGYPQLLRSLAQDQRSD